MNLPSELISYIHEFDNTYHEKYKKCIKELDDIIKNKILKNKLINILNFIKYAPLYAKPKFLNKNIKFYSLFNNYI